MDYYSIGQRIRKYRKALSLSQEELAEKAAISTTHMSHIETGSTKLSLPVITDLSRALQVPVDDLLGDRPLETRTEEKLREILQGTTAKEQEIVLDTVRAIVKSLHKNP